jgi:hypothetical protein
VRRRIAAALALGVLTTLAIAWPLTAALLVRGVIRHQHTSRATYTAPGGVECAVTSSRRALSDAFTIRPLRPENSYLPMGEPAQLPEWVAVPPNPSSKNLSAIDTGATGWPWRCFASESWQYREAVPGVPGQERMVITEVLRHNLLIAKNANGRVFLPLRPIWAGLAADVLVFALGWAGLFAGLRWARARRRVGRGLCAACGYDLRGTPRGVVCPECGHPQRVIAAPAGAKAEDQVHY